MEFNIVFIVRVVDNCACGEVRMWSLGVLQNSVSVCGNLCKHVCRSTCGCVLCLCVCCHRDWTNFTMTMKM